MRGTMPLLARLIDLLLRVAAEQVLRQGEKLPSDDRLDCCLLPLLSI